VSSFRVDGFGVGPDEDAFDRQRQISWWDQDRVERSKILIIGAGAVGNETLKNLVLLGVGYILVVDFDEVATSNLSRTVLFRRGDEAKNKAATAASRAAELKLNPAAAIEHLGADVAWDVGAGVFRRFDIVLGCVDNAEARLAINRTCFEVGIPWIDAGIHELACHVSAYQPGVTACYACNVTKSQLEDARRRYSCDAVRRAFLAQGRAPTVQVASALVSALQTQEALKLLCGHPLQAGRKLFFQGTTNTLDGFELRLNLKCGLHNRTIQAPVPTPHGRSTTLLEFFTWVNRTKSAERGSALDLTGLPWSLLSSVACGQCARRVILNRPNYRVLEDDCFCEACGPTASRTHSLDPQYITEIAVEESGSPLLQLTLGDLGFPIAGFVVIRGPRGDFVVYELTRDIADYFPGLAESPLPQGDNALCPT
jgi:molybdopterin-synthase adenylyltransferase